MEIEKGYLLVNLLPYREKNKKEKTNQVGLYFALYIAVAITVIFMWNSFISISLDNQNNRNKYISDQNTILDTKITEIKDLKDKIKETLEKRKVVEELQVNRSDVVNLLNRVSNLLPEGTSIKNIVEATDDQGREKITITGITQSNNKVSEYMMALESAGYVNPYLVETKAIPLVSGTTTKKEEISYSEFTIYMYIPKFEITIKDK